MRETTPACGDAVATLREASWRVDEQGRFAAADVAGARTAVEALVDRCPDHPAALFGPWHTLPRPLQDALRRAVERDADLAVRLYPSGSLWTGTIHGMRLADRYLAARKAPTRLRRLAIFSGERLHNGPLNVWRKLLRARGRARWMRVARPTVEDVLYAIGTEPRWLLGGFVRGAAAPRRRLSFHDDPRANIVHGYHLGLDLMPTPEGVYCLEVNLQPGVNWQEWPLEEADCHATQAIRSAQVHGARRIVWVEAQRYPIPDYLAADLELHATASGIRLDILDDPCAPRRVGTERRAHGIRGHYRTLDGSLPRDTLVLHRDEYFGGPDHMLSDKASCLRALGDALASSREPHVRILPMTREPPSDDLDDSGLPNLVYKYPDSWAGRGVFFMRARDPGHAVEMARRLDRERGEPPGLFQRFALPLPDGTNRVHDVRAEIYLTPRETRFVLAMRRVAAHEFPARMDYGLLEQRGVFAANTSAGGDIVQVPPQDRDSIHRATLATGDALRHALTSSFSTRSPTSGRA